MHPPFAERFEPDTLAGSPILELGARTWPPERYHAFKVCYQTMRWVDDLIDHRKSKSFPLEEADKARIKNQVLSWMLAAGGKEPEVAELNGIRRKFCLPWWPWQRWTKSMLYDLEHNGFRTFLDFLRYSEGAAVAPGAIFMHLCGLREQAKECRPPDFDIRPPARPLAIFCYLVHILRDFRSDLNQHLIYFADALLSAYGISRQDLERVGEGGPLAPAFRSLLHRYHGIAGYYGAKARRALDRVLPRLQPAYQVSLELVYGLYMQIYQRLDPDAGQFTAAETHPATAELHARILAILDRKQPA